ncbi:hypothetical protein [Tautonia sociabilis]|uniref:Uncharacterized protein n=1 Tax=Tautonia sociabilis TaxID=2080755 RepID=A0A432MLP4_9BACT|nr:hypothetical protein [Tautonia sociabilis]RUL88056.1 hypothetical protein TsocGM_08930 [Tautonia sociabilis]
MTDEAPERTQPGRRRRRWLLAAWLPLAILAGIPLLVWCSTPRFRPSPVPEPNGYDALLRAARSIQGPIPNQGEIGSASLEELRSWVEANLGALRDADEALDLPSGVPLSFSPSDDETILADTGAFRMLGRLMLADAIVAHQDGRVADSALRSIASIRLARQSSRNGTSMHWLTGMAIEDGCGLEGIRRIRDDLDPDLRRELLRRLREFEADRPDVEEVIARDRAWGEARLSRRTRVVLRVVPSVRRTMQALAVPAYDAMRDADRRNAASRRLLMIDLAIRSYRDRVGSLPDRLEDLAPEELPSVPTDPFADGPPVDRVLDGGDSSQLDSVGPEGKDDGGERYPKGEDWSKTPGDLGVDRPDR